MTQSAKRKRRKDNRPQAGARAEPPQLSEKRLASPVGSRAILIAIGLIALVAVIYLPVRHYGFVDLDDPQYVSENPYIAHGLTWAGVSWAFTSVYASYWLPMIWLSHMVDVQLYGLDAGGHHATNVILHAINSVLLFALLYRTTGSTWRSALVAGLFAAHPLRVESVVWITERKDVLSTLFLLLTCWSYVSYARERRWRHYLLALVWLALGLMTKSMLVTTPFLLLLLDVWPLNRFTITGWPLSAEQRTRLYRLVAEKLPFAALAVASAAVTYLTQETTGAVAGSDRASLAFRLGNALVSYAAYLGKMVWPAKLALFYPYPLSLSAWLVLSSALVLAIVSAIVVLRARQQPYLVVGWLWYLGTLVPVIGIIQAGDQARADRFTYVPLMGVFIMIAWGAFDLIKNVRVASMVAAAALIAYAVAARVQVGYWRTNKVLWQHALDATTESYVAHTNLGIALYGEGSVDQAIAHFRSALRLRPDYAEAHNDLGVALANRGDVDGAIQSFLNALRAKPRQAASHYNAAVLLARKGDTTAAAQHLEAALQINPSYGDARRELDRLRRP